MHRITKLSDSLVKSGLRNANFSLLCLKRVRGVLSKYVFDLINGR